MSDKFDPEVKMWVFEEKVDGKNLTEIINTQHENVKYLPGQYLCNTAVTCLSVCQGSFPKRLRRLGGNFEGSFPLHWFVSYVKYFYNQLTLKSGGGGGIFRHTRGQF